MAFERETQLALSKIADRAQAYTPEQAKAEMMEGLPQRGFLQSQQDQQAGKMQAMGGDTALLSRALDKKVGREYDIGLNRAEREIEAQSKLKPYDEVRRAMKLQNEEIRSLNRDTAISQRRYALAKEKESAEKEARASTLGSVLGVVGAVGGALIPGAGVAGAIAGGSLGSGVGKAAGR